MGKVVDNFAKYQKELKKTLERSARTFFKSVEPLILQETPMDTGALRDSLKFTKISTSLEGVEYKIHFGQGLVGDDGNSYASQVHEWTSVNINWTTEGTGPGFLIRPVTAYQEDLKDIIRLNAKRIKL